MKAKKYLFFLFSLYFFVPATAK